MTTVVLLAALCAFQAVFSFVQLVRAPHIGALVFVAAFSVLSVGLWRLNRIARSAAVVMLWLAITVLIVGTFNPFTAGDYIAGGGEAPAVWQMLARVAPAVAVCVLALHLLGKYKGEFGRKDDAL